MKAAARARLLLAAVLLATLAVYLPARDGPYQFDDHPGVALDAAARDAAAWWRGLGRHVRPVLKASYVATAAFGDGGATAAAHRLGNLALHLANVVLGYALALALQRRFAGRRAADADEDTPPMRLGALAAAATLALHPLATEAVSYVSGRSASLATGLAMLALLAWLRVRAHPGPRAAAWFAVGTLAWLAALGTREAALVVPLAWWIAERLADAAKPAPAGARGVALATALLLGLAVAIGLWAVVHPRYGPLLALSARIAEARLGSPVFAAALAHLGCVAALVCRPSIDPQPQVPGWAGGLLAGAVVLAGAWVAWRLRRRRPLVAFALAWAALWLLPTYALPIRHDVVAERHAYPALWSLGVLAAAALGALAGRLPVRGPTAPCARAGLLASLAAVVAVTLGVRTAQRNGDWRSEVALWEAARREAGRPTPRLLNNLGYAYLEAGRWDEARQVLAEAQQQAPDEPSIAVNLERARRRSMH